MGCFQNLDGEVTLALQTEGCRLNKPKRLLHPRQGLVYLAKNSHCLPVPINECPLSDSSCRRYKVISWPAMSIFIVDWCRGQPSVMGTKYVIPSPDSMVVPRQENTLASECKVHGISYQQSSLQEEMVETEKTGREVMGLRNQLSPSTGWSLSGSDQGLTFCTGSCSCFY